MNRSQKVFDEVVKLYSGATTSMGNWMWQNHTQWVADKAKSLAEKYGADPEQVYCAALLHDLGDSRFERGHEKFDSWSEATVIEILRRAGFDADQIASIQNIVKTHSSRPGNLPTTIEGKVLSTADGMWHLQTSFFPVICYMNRPDTTQSYEQWQEWFGGKIERDYNQKIYFDAERAEVEADYEALLRVFAKPALPGVDDDIHNSK